MYSPFEDWQQNQSTAEGRVQWYLSQQVESGAITSAQADQAMNTQSGALWDEAMAKVLADDPELKNSAWDFAQALIPFHAPIIWAKEIADGTPENIGPFSPMSRTLKGAAGLLGIDWDNSPLNIEGRLRKHLGLPAFDKWDDYKVDRMLSNMAGMGEITADEARRAMIERSGPAYDEAVRKAGIEFAGGSWPAFLAKMMGLPIQTYPEGEKMQRALTDDYQNAWKMKDAGNEEALTNFYDMHPEQSVRQALWDTPEERLHTFIRDGIWDKWLSLPKLQQDALKEVMGEEFQEKFLNKETRNYEAIPVETFQMWMKLMGGDPPGTLNSEMPKFEMPPDDVAWQAQAFYDTRKQYFPNYWKAQNEYYDLTTRSARKAYLKKHPELADYWDWRRDWMHRNPEAVPFLTDEFEFKYRSEWMEREAEQPGPWLTRDEIQATLGPNLYNLVEDHVYRGEPLSNAAERQVEEWADRLGISVDDLFAMFEER
jgi:hypothetical protein